MDNYLISNNSFFYNKNGEKAFEVKKGIVVLRGIIETLQPKLNIHQNVIDAWIEVLNFEEISSPKKQMQRYLFDTTIMVSFY